jgi:TPR repeat protein
MQDAAELFYESVQLGVRAKKAHTPRKRDALFIKEYDMLHRVLRVDPTFKEAQFNLASMYDKGKGVQQDYTQAASWYEKAADQGWVLAQYNLGLMYHKGQVVQQDLKQAAAWHRKAAEQGYAEAQFFLGNMYHQGKGVQQDSKQAAAWYRKAADQGNAEAHLMLGDLSERAGDDQAAFESYRAAQEARARHQLVTSEARAGMRRCLDSNIFVRFDAICFVMFILILVRTCVLILVCSNITNNAL